MKISKKNKNRKNKKMMALLAAGGMLAALSPTAAQALTVAAGQADGTIKYYRAGVMETETAAEEEAVECTATAAVVNEKFSRELFKESLAYLKEYGVTYEVDTDTVLYQGEKVRWLIDDQMEGYEASTLFSEDGTVDLYAERNAEGTLLGVRKASQEEFNRLDAQVKYSEEVVVQGTASVEAIEVESADESQEAGKAVFYELVEDPEEAVLSDNGEEDYILENEITEVAVASGSSTLSKEEQQREWKKAQEYKEIGIGQSENGLWTWNGEKIYILMDEDGSFYQSGSVSTKNDRLYVYVSRDENGKASKAEVVSGRELLEKKALIDETER